MTRFAKNHKFYAEFTKVDSDERVVSGYASTEAMDSQNEIVTRAAMETALPGWLKFGNIREMHQPSAVGVALKAHYDDKGLLLEAHVVDDAAWKKVTAGVYKGFSIGGRVKGRDKTNKAIITELDLTEISLVDRPANPEALFDVWKADGVQAEGQTEIGDDATKSMFGVGDLANILQQIQFAAQNADWEKQIEGDGSAMPEALKEWLKTGGQLLVQMAAEETAELNDDGQATVEVIVLAEAAGDVAKADAAVAAEPPVIVDNDVEKRGARNSSSDQKKLNDAHDAIVAAGADCASMKADNVNDLAKAKDDLSTAQADLSKVATQLAETQTSLGSVTKARDEATASLLALSKAHETATNDRDDFAKRNETLTAEKASLADELAAANAELEKFRSAPEPLKGKLLSVEKGQEVNVAQPEKKPATPVMTLVSPQKQWFTTRPTA